MRNLRPPRLGNPVLPVERAGELAVDGVVIHLLERFSIDTAILRTTTLIRHRLVSGCHVPVIPSVARWNRRVESRAAFPDHEPRVVPCGGPVRYDRAVIEDFLAHLPEAIRVDIPLGRELLRDLVSEVRISDEGPRPTICPLCGRVLAKLTPQHMACHELGLQEAYRRFPQLGFNRRARLVIQPGPHSLFGTLEVYGEVAGDGFEPSTFGL